MRFTSEQRLIIEAHPNQNIIVNACPGSGKTTTMIHRIVYIVQHHQIPLESIAMFTYNRSLGKDMSNKLIRLGINTINMAFCGTLHAFCYRETKDYQDLKPWIDRYTDESYRNDKLKYIIFDEYQDADEDIASVIKILAKDRFLMIVGDDKQQLYGYRGANINHLSNIKNDFVQYTLTETFRCNQNICAFLNRIWSSENANSSSKIIIRSQIVGPKPVLYRSRGNAMNNPDITEEIIRIVEKFQDGSIAIISPTVNSETSKRFLNDVHSNILNCTGISFSCHFNEIDRISSENKSQQYVISSIHESKGLEYDTVILLNALDNTYFFDCSGSSQQKDLSNSNITGYEARCKLFVGASRARQNLFIFEHHYHFTNGSIKWISENEDVFDRPSDPIWNLPPKFRTGDKSRFMERKCRDYIRGLNNEERRNLVEKYGPPEIIRTEYGMGEHPGTSSDSSSDGEYTTTKPDLSHVPALSGELIEILYAQKLGFPIRFEFRVYLTSSEWDQVLRNRDLPKSVVDKIYQVYPYRYVDIRRQVSRGKVKIIVLFVDLEDLAEIDPNDLSTAVQVREITENNIVSSFMCNLYYRYLNQAQETRCRIFNKFQLKESFVKDLWWLLKFRKLMDMSLVGFRQPNLKFDEINNIINYLNNAKILQEMHLTKYHPIYRKLLETEDESQELWVNGEVDFEGRYGIVELKCISSDNLEEAWLQVMTYNMIASDTDKPKYKYIYIYNALNGTLYRRQWKSPQINLPCCM